MTTRISMGTSAAALVLAGCAIGGDGGGGGPEAPAGDLPSGLRMTIDAADVEIDTINSCTVGESGAAAPLIASSIGLDPDRTLSVNLLPEDAAFADALRSGASATLADVAVSARWQPDTAAAEDFVVGADLWFGCTVEATFLRTEELVTREVMDRYAIDFACPKVPWLDVSDETEGTFATFEGDFECHARVQPTPF